VAGPQGLQFSGGISVPRGVRACVLRGSISRRDVNANSFGESGAYRKDSVLNAGLSCHTVRVS
jgi:hypothetical protein